MSTSTTTTLPADAGADLPGLRDEPRDATVLAAFPTAVYLAADDGHVLAVEASDGVGLPNALRLRRPASGLALGDVPVSSVLRVGDDRVELPGTTVVVDRWVDHTYVPADVDPVVLERRLVGLDATIAERAPLEGGLVARTGGLVAALVTSDLDAAAEHARGLVGLGPGLTPSGDDLLCGALAAVHTLAPRLALTDLDALATELGERLLVDAAARTTALSATLLLHAHRGQLARPARAVLRGLLGRTPVPPALDALLAVGHSSGRDLAVGLSLGAHVTLAAAADANTHTAPASTAGTPPATPSTPPTPGARR